MKPGWTQPPDLKEQLQKLWVQGRLLAWLVDGDSPFPLRLSLRGPTSRECSERFPEVREWAQALLQHAARHGLRLVLREWRHPVLGRNELPHEVWVDNSQDAWRWLGQLQAVPRFQQLVVAWHLAIFPKQQSGAIIYLGLYR